MSAAEVLLRGLTLYDSKLSELLSLVRRLEVEDHLAGLRDGILGECANQRRRIEDLVRRARVIGSLPREDATLALKALEYSLEGIKGRTRLLTTLFGALLAHESSLELPDVRSAERALQRFISDLTTLTKDIVPELSLNVAGILYEDYVSADMLLRSGGPWSEGRERKEG
ncbi:MAG: hypothetical protein J7L91_00100 [Candidatus Korarchaeota archaeon]|nr:hypothetical protein [Candidatus Korarchaeota archaeon]